MTVDRNLALRFTAVAMLAAAGAALFVFSRPAPKPPEPDRVQELRRLTPAVDRAVDSVLARFTAAKASRRTVPLPGSDLQRIEKFIKVPPAFPSIQLNQSLNEAAKEFGGRVVASENLKERLVTMHVELRDIIIETLVLKTESDPAPARRKRK